MFRRLYHTRCSIGIAAFIVDVSGSGWTGCIRGRPIARFGGCWATLLLSLYYLMLHNIKLLSGPCTDLSILPNNSCIHDQLGKIEIFIKRAIANSQGDYDG